jgi:pimeloyl-ACP methyl ester carboxylesterase
MPAREIANTTSFVEIAGRKTQVLKGGEGPPLLYLHSAAGECDWTVFHNKLAGRFTVYAPAHPGFGLSAGLEEIRDIHDVVWHYVDLIAALGLGRIPVVGFSLGAWIAMELAILRPATVERLVLAAAVGLHVPNAPIAELFIDDLDKLRRLLFFDPNDPCADDVVPRSIEDRRFLMWLRAREATARIGWNPYLHNPRLTSHLHRIECAALILWGREDKVVPLAHGQFLADHLPQAKLRVFERCGHMLPFERADAFAAETTAFLAR